MFQLSRHYRAYLIKSGLLLAVVIGATYFGGQLMAHPPGSLDDVFFHLQVGMGSQEALAILATAKDLDDFHAAGTTKAGKPFAVLFNIDYLPPGKEIERANVWLLDSKGRELEVFLGPAGKVSGKRLLPNLWEYRLQKIHRQLHDNRFSVLLGVAAGLGLTLAWALQRWVASKGGISSELKGRNELT